MSYYPDGCLETDPHFNFDSRECVYYCPECDEDVRGVIEYYSREATFYHDVENGQHAIDVSDDEC